MEKAKKNIKFIEFKIKVTNQRKEKLLITKN